MEDLIIKEPVTLSTPIEQVEKSLMEETDIDDLNNIINIFNLNMKKKDLIRTGKLNNLQDRVTDQMSERITYHADEFSNKDLLDYFKVLQDTITKSDNSLDSIDVPAIQFNQQNINITQEDKLSRESKEKVKDVISKILQQVKN